MKIHSLFMGLSIAAIAELSYANIQIDTNKHWQSPKPEILTSDSAYGINIPKPVNGVSTLYLNTSSHVETVNRTILLNNATTGNQKNALLEGASASTVRIVLSNTYSLDLQSSITLAGSHADIELVGMNEFTCNNCKFNNVHDVIIKTGDGSEDSDANANGVFKLMNNVQLNKGRSPAVFSSFTVYAGDLDLNGLPYNGLANIFEFEWIKQGDLNLNGTYKIKRFKLTSRNHLELHPNTHIRSHFLTLRGKHVTIHNGATINKGSLLNIKADKITNHANLTFNDVHIDAPQGFSNSTVRKYKNFGNMVPQTIDELPYLVYTEDEKRTKNDKIITFNTDMYAISAFDVNAMKTNSAKIKALDTLTIDTNNLNNFFGVIGAKSLQANNTSPRPYTLYNKKRSLGRVEQEIWKKRCRYSWHGKRCRYTYRYNKLKNRYDTGWINNRQVLMTSHIEAN